jgi:hypothetical protein
MARGRPAPSAMAMILVPLPRLVFPTWSPFFGAGKRAVDERLAEIQAAPGVEIRRECLEEAPERAGADPALKAAMTCLIRRIALWQVLPGRARAEDPEDAVQHIARIAPRSPTTIATDPRLRQERRETGPLRVGEVHAVEYDGQYTCVSSHRFGICEIGSSVLTTYVAT